MVATNTPGNAERSAEDSDAHDLGLAREESPRHWRWHCGRCPGSSIGTYPTKDAALDGLHRHHEAAEVIHR